MQFVNRKHESIDIIKLYSQSNHARWNAFLNDCHAKKDINRLLATLYGLQAGMKDAADAGLASEKLSLFFIRLERSLEKTIQLIDRSRKTTGQTKRQKDNALEAMLHKERF